MNKIARGLTSLAHSTTQLDVATTIARGAASLLPLMERFGVQPLISLMRAGELAIVDATCNSTRAFKAHGALAGVNEAIQGGYTRVWTASAGNHGAGVAMAAQLLGCAATVYVPMAAPKSKLDNILSFGANLVQVGSCFDECLAIARAEELANRESSHFVHPFDDICVAAGQGTIGLKIVAFAKERAALGDTRRISLFVPIGGGGLIAGIASSIRYFWPQELESPKMYGVIDEGVPASVLGSLFGRPVRTIPATIADGTRVAQVGETFLAVSHLIDHLLLIPHDELVRTIQRQFSHYSSVIEPAGALALAGEYLAKKHGLTGTNDLHMALLSGRNVDQDAFNDLLEERSTRLRHGDRRMTFDIHLPERAGELLNFLHTVQEFNITRLLYKQVSGAQNGILRAEFEVPEHRSDTLTAVINRKFPQASILAPGHEMLLNVSAPVARDYHPELIELTDEPGSFLSYLKRRSSEEGGLGDIGFLFYRRPHISSLNAQVVMGTAAPRLIVH